MKNLGQNLLLRTRVVVCYFKGFFLLQLLGLQKEFIVQGAIEWLEKNQDKTLEEITTPKEDDPNVEPPALKAGEEARSLMCNECEKRFRSREQAEFHATRTGHVDFAESIEEIAPLTEAEKKAKLEDLRQKLAQKRAGSSEQDKLDQKKNEVCKLRDSLHLYSFQILFLWVPDI